MRPCRSSSQPNTTHLCQGGVLHPPVCWQHGSLQSLMLACPYLLPHAPLARPTINPAPCPQPHPSQTLRASHTHLQERHYWRCPHPPCLVQWCLLPPVRHPHFGTTHIHHDLHLRVWRGGEEGQHTVTQQGGGRQQAGCSEQGVESKQGAKGVLSCAQQATCCPSGHSSHPYSPRAGCHQRLQCGGLCACRSHPHSGLRPHAAAASAAACPHHTRQCTVLRLS